MLDNAAVAALLTVAGVTAFVILLCAPAIYARTGRSLPERVRKQRAEALLDAVANLPSRRRDGAVNTTALVDDCGRNARERYQVLRFLLEAGLVERRHLVGPTLMPSYLRLTDSGWAECAAIRARREDRNKKPTPITMTYLNTAGQDEARTVGDDVVFGPNEQQLRELYVALRADAREIYAKGVRADANDCADEVERSLDSGDRRAQWAAVDRAGHLVALAESEFTLTVMVLRRLFGAQDEHSASSGRHHAAG